MGSKGDDVAEAELGVLETLWDRGPCTVRQVMEALYPDGGASAYATTQKLLERLESKGFAARNRSGAVQTFEATLGRDELIERRLRSLADRLCRGSFASLVSHLVGGRKLSDQERRELRRHLDRLDREQDPKA